MSIESYYRYLTSSQLSKIAAYGGIMIEKQDKTINILNSVKEATSAIKQDTALLPSIKEDTAAIKKNTESLPEMFSKILREIER